MTDREIMQQSLDALDYEAKRGNDDAYHPLRGALRERLLHCDRCGKRLGGEGDIHTCTPLIGCVQHDCAKCKARLAQPEQEPVATVQCINGITIGYLEVMQPVGTKLYTTPPAAQPESVQPVSMYEDWYDSNSCSHCGMVGGHVKTCRHYTTPPAAMTEFEEAVAAVDNTLHHAIDHWQDKASEQAALLRECRFAIDELIKKKPILTSLLCGSNTLGNLRASLYDYRPQAAHGIKEKNNG